MASRELLITRRAVAMGALQKMLGITPTRDIDMNVVVLFEACLDALNSVEAQTVKTTPKWTAVETVMIGLHESNAEEISQAFGISEASAAKLLNKSKEFLTK